ncbi:hypothetical protein B0H17DRAFT_1144447 [Mycena rosella]|uniref:Uncharacterized protein n=1 Tax=Mycena rosella TaxID=1033263 RepID=A0AAD7CT57_MYCRO|nr:hypothetical protein B0H17DRAFT_1144447 [Mycena rosella]
MAEIHRLLFPPIFLCASSLFPGCPEGLMDMNSAAYMQSSLGRGIRAGAKREEGERSEDGKERVMGQIMDTITGFESKWSGLIYSTRKLSGRLLAENKHVRQWRTIRNPEASRDMGPFRL